MATTRKRTTAPKTSKTTTRAPKAATTRRASAPRAKKARAMESDVLTPREADRANPKGPGRGVRPAEEVKSVNPEGDGMTAALLSEQQLRDRALTGEQPERDRRPTSRARELLEEERGDDAKLDDDPMEAPKDLNFDRTDSLSQELGEEYVRGVTSGEHAAPEMMDEVTPEEIGGPFQITRDVDEFAAGTDASNPEDAEPAALPTAMPTKD